MKKIYSKPKSMVINLEAESVICMSNEGANNSTQSIGTATQHNDSDGDLAGGYRSNLWD